MDSRQEETEVELERPKNTSRSRGGRPTSSTLSKGGGKRCTMGYRLYPHLSRTKIVGLEEVKAEVQ